MATRIVPKSELRDRIRAELAELRDDSLVITDRGKPIAVTVSVERWNQLQESIEDLEDRAAVLEHRASGDPGRSAEPVFDSIEASEADVPDPARQTG
jgi:prevent-host-death family protein